MFLLCKNKLPQEIIIRLSLLWYIQEKMTQISINYLKKLINISPQTRLGDIDGDFYKYIY